jgi:hypothetical protein
MWGCNLAIGLIQKIVSLELKPDGHEPIVHQFSARKAEKQTLKI